MAIAARKQHVLYRRAPRVSVHFALIVIVTVAALVSKRACGQSSHAALDWNAPLRWVHVDHVAAERSRVFKDARTGWLQSLRRGDSLLADGRPLFWELRAGDHNVYYTLYPFTRFAELDARRESTVATNRIVGQEVVDRYDTGTDSVLIPPHYSQIWRRAPDLDFVPPEGDSLTDRTAACGWVEFQTPDFYQGDQIDSLWKQIVASLAAERYPLTCRSFRNAYGPSGVIRMWLAADSSMLRKAPPVKAVVARHLGSDRTNDIFRRLDAVLPTAESLPAIRRADLSNLGK